MRSLPENLQQASQLHGCNVVMDCKVDAGAVRVAMVGNAYHEQIFAGVAAYARQAGWDLDATCFHTPGCLPKQENWSGVLVTPFFDSLEEWVGEVSCPVVELLSARELDPPRPRVVADRRAVGRCGAAHLLELGNILFGYYRAFAKYPDCGNGFIEEMKARGFSVTLLGLDLASKQADRTRTTREERMAWLSERLAKMKPPMAIMADDDRFAVDLYLVARALGLRVPDDVAILGADDQKLALCSVPIGISSVDPNYFEMGWRGAEILGRLMNGALPGTEEVPWITRVQPKDVVARESTATFVCDDPAVTAAALFVRRRFRDPITVEQVAAAAGISVRSLQAKYPAHLGRGVKEDILWYRLMEAKSLIERTDLKIATVAAESGLGTTAHLHRVFQQVLETTPHAWRMRHGKRCSGGL